MVIGLHLAWSGNHRLLVDRLADGRSYAQLGELLSSGEMALSPNDELSMPEVLVAWSGAGVNGIRAAFHRHLRARPNHPRRPRPVHLNTWEAVYFDHEPQRLSELANAAAEIGVERFVLDDGWFLNRNNDRAGLGDWYVDPTKYPDGLARLIGHVRSLGMEFGLWVEPEMVNPDSDLFRAHPDWALSSPGYDPVLGRNQLVLDLQHRDAFAYLLERLDGLLANHDIAYLKWDHNRVLTHATHDGRPAGHGQTLAYYRLLDELLTRHPTVEIESCASGGGRIDFGVLDRCVRAWTSDCNDALERQTIQAGLGIFVAPELMGAHIGPPRSHTTGRTHGLGFRAATAVFGHLGIEWDITKATSAERVDLSRAVSLHKELRPLLHHGRSLRLDGVDPSVVGHGVVALDQSEAVYCLVQMATPSTSVPFPARLAGLAADRIYRVEVEPLGDRPWGPMRDRPRWIEEGVAASGAALAGIGLPMPILQPEHAVLVRVRPEGPEGP